MAANNGLFIRDVLPVVLTNDVVGTVVALGPGVSKYALGDRVVSHAGFAPGGVQSGLQEYALHDIGAGVKIPDSVSDDEAVTLPTALIAPLFGLFSKDKGLGIPAPWTSEAAEFGYTGTSLLIVGGGSSCGKFAVQLAALAGIGRIVVVGGPEEELKSYGATHIINRHLGFDAVLEQIRAVVGDELYYAFDAINMPEGQLLAANALSSHKRGRLARLLTSFGPVDESRVVGKKAGFQVVNVLGLSQLQPEIAYPFWERVPELLTSGKLRPLGFVINDGLTVENVSEVFQAYKEGKRVTKTHIHI